MQSPFCLAKEMGKGLGTGEILLRSVQKEPTQNSDSKHEPGRETDLNMIQPEAELIRLRERHTELEFATMDTEAIVATMTPNDDVNHI